jgi:hypothetical protein
MLATLVPSTEDEAVEQLHMISMQQNLRNSSTFLRFARGTHEGSSCSTRALEIVHHVVAARRWAD